MPSKHRFELWFAVNDANGDLIGAWRDDTRVEVYGGGPVVVDRALAVLRAMMSLDPDEVLDVDIGYTDDTGVAHLFDVAGERGLFVQFRKVD